MLLKRFPRYELTFGPTPIQPLRWLSAHLGGSVELSAKREDCNSGLAFGGNKTRKLEFLIPEALAQRCDTLVSIDGVQSNQTRQVAAVAAHLGMRCVLVQENWVNYCDAAYDRVGNIELSRMLGRGSTPGSRRFDITIRPSWERALEDVRRSGGKPFPIPAGCSEHPLEAVCLQVGLPLGCCTGTPAHWKHPSSRRTPAAPAPLGSVASCPAPPLFSMRMLDLIRCQPVAGRAQCARAVPLAFLTALGSCTLHTFASVSHHRRQLFFPALHSRGCAASRDTRAVAQSGNFNLRKAA